MGNRESDFLELGKMVRTPRGMKETIQSESLSKDDLQEISDGMIGVKMLYVGRKENIELEIEQYKLLLVDCHCEVTLPDSFCGVINIGYNSNVVINTDYQCDIVVNVATPTSTLLVNAKDSKSKVQINKLEVKQNGTSV